MTLHDATESTKDRVKRKKKEMIEKESIRKRTENAPRNCTSKTRPERVRYQEGEGGSCREHSEVDCEVLTINKQSSDTERGINVGNDDFDVGAGDTRA